MTYALPSSRTRSQGPGRFTAAGPLLLVGLDALPSGLEGAAARLFAAGTPPRGTHFGAALVSAAGLTEPACDWIRAPEQAGLPLVVLADEAHADAAGLLLDASITAFLPPDAPPELLDEALAAAASGEGVRDARGSYNLAWPAPAPASAADPARPVDAARIRAHIRARRLRERFLPASLFADPAWDILLDLAAARLEGRLVSVSSLCIAAAVPTTTALRWIKNMVDQDMLLRVDDRQDARRAFITLAPATANRLEDCLAACFNHPGL
jgi:DNA-binding MarR family transcriptional regulator